MIKLLIFDFDGTIADTKKAYYSSIYRNLQKKGFNKKEIKLKHILSHQSGLYRFKEKITQEDLLDWNKILLEMPREYESALSKASNLKIPICL